MRPEQINKNLIWDYDWNETEYETEEFEKWYVQRVLTRGSLDDIKKVGLEKIREIIEEIMLPRRIRIFWEWGLKEKWPAKV
jgi:hypothetical protein